MDQSGELFVLAIARPSFGCGSFREDCSWADAKSFYEAGSRPGRLDRGSEGVVLVEFILWMAAKSISHHLRNHGKPLFVGIYRGIIIPVFHMWCEMDFVHPQ